MVMCVLIPHRKDEMMHRSWKYTGRFHLLWKLVYDGWPLSLFTLACELHWRSNLRTKSMLTLYLCKRARDETEAELCCWD